MPRLSGRMIARAVLRRVERNAATYGSRRCLHRTALYEGFFRHNNKQYGHVRFCFVRSASSSSPRHHERQGDESSSSLPEEQPVDWIEQLKSPPNMITISRIAFTPVISYWILNSQFKEALAGCLVAAISDGIDGYLAKHHGMSTLLGSYLDPLADKLLINTVAISLWYSNPALLPTPLIALWTVKDVVLLGATSQMLMSGTKTLQVHPTSIAKWNTTLQFVTLSATMIHPIVLPLEEPAALVLQGLWWTTATTTLAAAWSYVGYTAFSSDDATSTLKTTVRKFQPDDRMNEKLTAVVEKEDPESTSTRQ